MDIVFISHLERSFALACMVNGNHTVLPKWHKFSGTTLNQGFNCIKKDLRLCSCVLVYPYNYYYNY